MTTTTLTKTPRTIIAASTSNSAGSSTRGTADLRTAQGGLLTVKVTNGATGPTVPATVNILVAHDAGATPTAGAAGADWKTIWSFAASTGNNAVTEQSITIDPGVMHLEVEVTGNTAQAVTCEAYLSEITSAVTA
jgi:hypothetical protein